MASRQTAGLFIAPINESTGLSVVSISFALAIAQIVWGIAQPLFGIVADHKGFSSVIALGGLLLAAGLALTTLADEPWSLVLTLGILSAAGAGAGSFSILFGAVAQLLPLKRRAFAGGFINAGGSFGQFIFAPMLQMIISNFSWAAAMLTMAAATLITIPLGSFMRVNKDTIEPSSHGGHPTGLMQQIRQAMSDPSYLCLNAGFFTCGFHIAFLVTHLPGEIALCGHTASVSAATLSIIGLFNIAGSLFVGMISNRFRMKYILAVLYGSRAVMIAAYLLAPKTQLTFYVFAASLGFTWLATVPPTAGLVGKLYGARYLATLFGITLFTHQIGGFLGAWLGGLAVHHDGNYLWMWYADIALASLAAVVNLPIRERRV
ncbi:MAG: MFS transporter [Acidobacteriota bacterium]